MTILRWSKIAGRAAFHAARDGKSGRQSIAYHGHDFAEIFWIDAGRGVHEINGASLPLQRGSLVLMRPSDCHGIRPLGPEELKLTNIAFPSDTLVFLRTHYFPGGRWLFSTSEKYPVARLVEPPDLSRYNRWADELSRSPRQRVYLARFLLNVLTELNLKQQAAPLDDAPNWLTLACRAIEERNHFSKGVEEFLRLCGRSREHAARSVRQHLGVTPTEYVNRIRMTYAMRELEMGDQGILDIALDCGVENMSHFYALFRHQTGTTPRKYRLAHRQSV